MNSGKGNKSEERLVNNNVICYEAVPTLYKLWNPVIASSSKRSPFTDYDTHLDLFDYISALDNLLKQLILSINRLKTYSDSEPSNITMEFVSYYTYNFFVRIKTALDIVALILNLVFCLGLRNFCCEIEGEKFQKRILKLCGKDSMLPKLLSTINDNWFNDYVKLRNQFVHRAGIKFIINGMGGYPIHIILPLPDRAFTKTDTHMEDPLKTLNHCVMMILY